MLNNHTLKVPVALATWNQAGAEGIGIFLSYNRNLIIDYSQSWSLQNDLDPMIGSRAPHTNLCLLQ